jgi:single-strand DNA-binding protein
MQMLDGAPAGQQQGNQAPQGTFNAQPQQTGGYQQQPQYQPPQQGYQQPQGGYQRK